jgi:DNA invertase Pin-like site-specific DNA recombinase
MLSTNTPNGKAMIVLFGVIAELKSDLTSARVREARMLSKDKPKEPKAAPVVHAPIENPTSKDIGSVMQAIAVDRERSKFSFTGKVRAYIRCSTKDQTVEQQRLCILKQLPQDMKDAEIIWYEDEGASAFKTSLSKRKAGAKMMDDLQAGDIVVAWRPDRIFRSMLDMARMTEAIHAKGSYLMTVEGGIKTDTPFGKTVVSLLSLLAEVESQEISRSTKQGQMVALGVNPAAQAARLPKMLSECKDRAGQKYFCFNQFFSKAERFSMHIQLTLTEKNFRDRRTACRVISNQWLKRKGFPSLTGENGDTLAMYQAKVKKMQKEEFSEKRDRLLDLLKKYSKAPLVMYPLNVDTIAHVFRRQTEWIRIAKAIPGRLRDKEGLTAMAATCRNPEEAVKVMEVLK